MLRNRQDFYAGGLCILLGLGGMLEAHRYPDGVLRDIGPGFYPTALGALLTLVGIAIAGTALSAAAVDDGDNADLAAKPEWRGWICIIAGVVLFVGLAGSAGMVPATFACVLVSALGDRRSSLRESLLLATVVTGFGAVLFGWLLRVGLPLWQ